MRVVAPEVPNEVRDLLCPFCKSGLEFQVSESMATVGLTFHCLNCQKTLKVSNYIKETAEEPQPHL